ncbi:SF3a splicing factor complex subunit [Phlyctochytrium bullatum]|nr:SF3a splicing factor complex subunit [Phlyctochytrium bullatum]
MATNTGLSGLKGIKIRTDYVPKGKRTVKAAVVTQLCPRCRRAIPASEMDEHVRIELLDPKWREQRDRAAENSSGTNLLTDESIAENLKRIRDYRLDIFDGDEISSRDKVDKLRQKAKEKEDKIWDGHSTTIVSVQQKAFSAGMAELQASIQQRIREEAEKSKIGPQAPNAGKATPGATIAGSMTVLPPTFVPFNAASLPPNPAAAAASLPPPPPRVPAPPPTIPAPALPLPPPTPATSSSAASSAKPPPPPPVAVPPPSLPKVPAPPPPATTTAPTPFQAHPSATIEAKPVLNRRGLATLGVSPEEAAAVVQASLAGSTRTYSEANGDEAPAMLPPAKRTKIEPTLPGFIPELHFMGMAKGAITVQIRVMPNPAIAKAQWKVPDNPHTFLKIPGVRPNQLVAELKDMISKETGWPASRQKLTLEERTGHGFYTGRHVLKDANTAAYYNLAGGDVIELTVKERGGKK